MNAEYTTIVLYTKINKQFSTVQYIDYDTLTFLKGFYTGDFSETKKNYTKNSGKIYYYTEEETSSYQVNHSIMIYW